MSENTSEQKNSALKLLLLGVWALYALIAFCINHTPENGTPAAAPPEETAAGTTVSAAGTGATVLPSGSEPAAAVPRDIYLTFDDGPCKNTPQVLDILDHYGARATFFTVGTYVDRYPEYAAEIVNRGNLIACHSYTHDMKKCYASADAFMNELAQWRQAAQSACGELPERLCVRFPGGSTTKYAAAVSEEIKQRIVADGYQWFDWNAGDNDKWQKGNTEQLPDEEYFMKSYRETIGWFDDEPETPVVFLFHDTEDGTVSILPAVLQDLIGRGYRFKLLDSHPKWEES